MAVTDDEFRRALGHFASKVGPLATEASTFKGVNSDGTITVVDDEGNESIVRLQCVVNSNKADISTPSAGANTLAVRIEDSKYWVLIGSDAVDTREIVVAKEFSVTAGESVLDIKPAGHSITKGTDSLKDALVDIIEAVQQIVVIYGNNPDYDKLSEALTKINNIFS